MEMHGTNSFLVSLSLEERSKCQAPFVPLQNYAHSIMQHPHRSSSLTSSHHATYLAGHDIVGKTDSGASLLDESMIGAKLASVVIGTCPQGIAGDQMDRASAAG